MGAADCCSSERRFSQARRSSARLLRASKCCSPRAAVQGVGAALLLPNSLALLNAAYSGEARGRAVGIWAASGAAAAAVAPLIGGWLVDNVGWPSIFYINLPLAAGAIALAIAFVTESRDAGSGRTDYAGALLATAGLGGVTYALTLWSASGRVSATVTQMALAGAGMLALFLWIEHRRGGKAMMPLDMFTGRCFAGLNLLTFLLYGAFGAAMLLIPYVLIEAAGYSPVRGRDGDAAACRSCSLLASPTMGRLAARIGPEAAAQRRSSCRRGGNAARQRGSGPRRPTGSVAFPAIAVMAAGMAIAVAPLTSSVLGSVEERHVGMASGFNSAVARTGGLIATALLGAVLGQSGASLFGSFHAAMVVSAVAAALAAAVALTMLGGVKMKEA